MAEGAAVPEQKAQGQLFSACPKVLASTEGTAASLVLGRQIRLSRYSSTELRVLGLPSATSFLQRGERLLFVVLLRGTGCYGSSLPGTTSQVWGSGQGTAPRQRCCVEGGLRISPPQPQTSLALEQEEGGFGAHGTSL